MRNPVQKWRLTTGAAYGVATVAIALALWVRHGLEPIVGPQGPFTILLVAVVVAAYLGGIGPGLYATATTALLGAFFFLRGENGTLGYREQLGTASYTVVALLVTWLCERLRRSVVFNQEMAVHLEASRGRLANLFDSVTDGMLALTPEWRITQVNQEALGALGSPAENPIGLDLWEVAPHWIGTTIETKLREAVATVSPQRFEVFDEKLGVWLDVSIYPSIHGLVVYLRNIAERKERESELDRISLERARAYAKLDALLAHAPIGLAYFDQGHRYLRINNYLAQINGISALETIGRTVSEVLPNLAPSIEPLLDEVFRAREAIQNVELVGETPLEANALRSWLVSFYPVLSDEGMVQAVGMIVTEITERKRSEELVRSSEERYRSLVSASSSIVWSTDAEGRFQDLQTSWQKYTGQTFEKQKAQGWIDAFHPDDQDRIRQEWTRSLSLRLIYQSHARLWNELTGDYRHVLIRAAPVLNADRTVREWVGTVADVNETRTVEEALKSSEERNRLLVEVAANIVWTTNVEGCVTSPQPQWETSTGQSWPEQEGKGWIKCFDRADRPSVRRALSECGKHGETQRFEAQLWDSQTSEYRFVYVHCVPLKREDGTIVEWIWMAADVHEKKTWEEERERLLAGEQAARGEAERANRLKDEFIATMSHELRTPLTTILGWSELLQFKLEQPDTLLQGLQAIERSTRVQAQLIEDLLDVSRISSGKLRLDLEDLDFNEIVKAAVDSLYQSMDAKGVQVRTEAEKPLCTVLGNGERLTQVVWNLLSNAIKFTPQGGEIRVTLDAIDGHAVLTVKDNGEGIDPAFLPHVFERFRQSDSSIARKHGGLGLGLSIVNQLVTMHGGTVTASSPGVGQGSTFVVRLPLVVPSGTSRRRIRGVRPCVEGLLVMLVDDDPDAIEILSRILEEEGATVHAFHSAEEALKSFEEIKPDVLISDLAMPGQNGFQLIQQVRKRENGVSTPAIAVTALTRPEEREVALLAGFNDHVSKPVESARLFESVRRVLHGDAPPPPRE